MRTLLGRWWVEFSWRIHEWRLRRKEDRALAGKKEKFKQALMDPAIPIDGRFAAKMHMFGGRPREPQGEWSAKFLADHCFAKDEFEIKSARKERARAHEKEIRDAEKSSSEGGGGGALSFPDQQGGALSEAVTCQDGITRSENEDHNTEERSKKSWIEKFVKDLEDQPITSIKTYGMGLGLPDLSTRISVEEEKKRRRKAAQGNVSLAQPTEGGALSSASDTRGALSKVDKKDVS